MLAMPDSPQRNFHLLQYKQTTDSRLKLLGKKEERKKKEEPVPENIKAAIEAAVVSV
jgi:hypothetical protein